MEESGWKWGQKRKTIKSLGPYRQLKDAAFGSASDGQALEISC